jgi:hypothetical protein
MRKIIAACCFLLILSPSLFGAGGAGGPMGMIYLISNIAPVNSYIAALNIPPFDNTNYMIGGTGVNWFTDTIGIGGMLTAGSQSRKQWNNYATLTVAAASILIQNIFHEGRRSQYSVIYGPGYTYVRFLLDDSVTQQEMMINSMTFCIAFTAQFKISEYLRLELELGLNTVAENQWQRVSGSGSLPADGNMSGYFGGLALKFGGRAFLD